MGGQYVPIAQASIPITDLGFLHSDATYDVVTVWDGAFFRLAPGVDDAQIAAISSECVRRSGLRASYVEMLCTRGQTPWGSRDPR